MLTHHPKSIEIDSWELRQTLMDSAVMGGDYGALHMLTVCVYHISRLIALMEIHLPVEG
jgi:hypothetical protein